MNFFDRFKTKFEKRDTRRSAKKESDASDTKKESKKSDEAVAEAPKHQVTTKEAVTAYRFLTKPFVTEKSAVHASHGKYSFVVSRDATKLAIKQAIKEVYNVMPEAVNIMNRQGKAVRFGRSNGRRKDWKIALVTLPKGKSLPIYD